MIEFSGPVWRILFQSQAGSPLDPARAPEGRFHHHGQSALYASLSEEGAGVAIRRYVSAGDPARVIQRCQVTASLHDLRGRREVSVVWQDIAAVDLPSPTWAYSDKARALGAQGMLYSSRSRPDLSHLVLFDITPTTIRTASQPYPWHPDAYLSLDP